MIFETLFKNSRQSSWKQEKYYEAKLGVHVDQLRTYQTLKNRLQSHRTRNFWNLYFTKWKTRSCQSIWSLWSVTIKAFFTSIKHKNFVVFIRFFLKSATQIQGLFNFQIRNEILRFSTWFLVRNTVFENN